MKRRPLVVGNWKMHNTCAATRSWCASFAEELGGGARADGVELGVAPPATALAALRDAARDLPVAVVAQNCHHEPSGAYTGELSVGMLLELGCSMVILGHSERRQFFGETDQAVGRKAAAVHQAGMRPIVCVGESENQRASGRTETVIEAQLRHGLDEMEIGDGDALVVAYEPVWAIGTGKVATPQQAQAAHAFLRGILSSIAGSGVADEVRMLYGGSVKPGNAAELAAQADIDGFLVGGASLDPAAFRAIAAAF
jgi:triosephosphate isomerase